MIELPMEAKEVNSLLSTSQTKNDSMNHVVATAQIVVMHVFELYLALILSGSVLVVFKRGISSFTLFA